MTVTRIITPAPVLAALFCLAGCKTPIAAELYASDLIATAGGAAMTASLVIGVEMPTDRCATDAPRIADAAAGQGASLRFVDCRRIEFSTYARFSATVPVVTYDRPAPIPETAFAIGTVTTDRHLNAGLMVNHDILRAIFDDIPEDVRGFRAFDFQPVVTAILNNDTGTALEVVTLDAFVDGIARPGTTRREIAHRASVEIAASDVANTAFGGPQHTVFLAAVAVKDGTQ